MIDVAQKDDGYVVAMTLLRITSLLLSQSQAGHSITGARSIQSHGSTWLEDRAVATKWKGLQAIQFSILVGDDCTPTRDEGSEAKTKPLNQGCPTAQRGAGNADFDLIY